MTAAAPPRHRVVLELHDVVLAAGPKGSEDVILRGADLQVRAGERLLVSGLPTARRRALVLLLTGAAAPQYGTVHRAALAVVDAGPEATAVELGRLLADRGGAAVLVLAERVRGAVTVDREVIVAGGRFAAPPVRRLPVGELTTRVREAVQGTGANAEVAELVAGCSWTPKGAVTRRTGSRCCPPTWPGQRLAASTSAQPRGCARPARLWLWWTPGRGTARWLRTWAPDGAPGAPPSSGSPSPQCARTTMSACSLPTGGRSSVRASPR